MNRSFESSNILVLGVTGQLGMAYIGTVVDDTKKILGREPLLLKDWAKLHANELLEIAGS